MGDFKVGDVVQYFDANKKFRVGKVEKVGRKWITVDIGCGEKVKKGEEDLQLYSEYRRKIEEEAAKARGKKK